MQEPIELQRLYWLAEGLKPGIERVTGRSLSLDTLVFQLSDGDFSNDPDQIRFREILAPVSRQRTRYDRLNDVLEGRLLENMTSTASRKAMEKVGLVMKYNGCNSEGKYLIELNPRFKDSNDVYLKLFLAHELVHPMDDRDYRFMERVEGMVQHIAETQIELSRQRKSEGLIRGVLAISPAIRGLEETLEQRRGELQAYMSLIEGHANYVKEQLEDGIVRNTRYKKLYDKSMIIATLMALPFHALPNIRNKLAQYKRAKNLIEEAYEAGIGVGTLYTQPPTLAELKVPEDYFSRIKQNVKS